MFTDEEIKKIRQYYHMAWDRIEHYNIRCFVGFKKPVFLISNTYPGVWLEHAYDSVFLAEMDGRYLELAKNTLCLFLDNQKENGQIPCYVIDKGVAEAFWPALGFSQVQECVCFTRLCYEYYVMSKDLLFLRYAYDKCRKWQKWYQVYRANKGNGLIEMFCGFDTGHDNSCRMDGVKYRGTAKDNDAAQYPADDAVLPIIAPDMNAVYYGTLQALADMANALGEKEAAQKWHQEADKIKSALFAVCYDQTDHFFYDVGKHGNKRKHLSISITNVLSEHLPDGQLAKEIFEKHLKNPHEFYTEYPFPAIARSDPGFLRNADGNSWNYYSQALTVLRCTRWMDFYGFREDFDIILEKWVRQWTFSGGIMFGQELDPISGEPSQCSQWYSSCMLVYIYAVKRLGLLDLV